MEAQWEYAIVKPGGDGNIALYRDGKAIGGTTLSSYDHPNLAEYINNLGKEGWELAGVAGDGTLYFKRQINRPKYGSEEL